MKARAILLLFAVVFASSLAAMSSFACSQPGTTARLESWAANAVVSIINSNVPSGSVSTATTNWNAALLAKSNCTPIFEPGAGYPETINMNFGSLPPQTPCPVGSTCPTKGLTDFTRATFTSAGRLSSVPITINSSMTVAAAITEVVAHELGHTFGLADCKFSAGCPAGSSVMESGVKVTSINTLTGQPGPTPCDVTAVMAFDSDYVCAGCPDPGTCPPNYLWNYNTCSCVKVSPIVLDISGKGFFLTDAQNGVLFDPGIGHPVQMAWTAKGADNAFLALPGPDGVVHSGKELFGNFTSQPASNNPNGFAALAVYDQVANGGNADGVIDSKDAIFSSLRLWIDANHDGISQLEELHTLPELGVNSISLTYKADHRVDQFGNVFRYRAQINPGAPADVGRLAYDVFFVFQLNSNTATKRTVPLGGKCQIPTHDVGMLATMGGSR